MIIDLLTIIAQIVNFLVLVFLLKKFLFDKIIKIMDERKEQIASQFEAAEQQGKEAEEELIRLRNMQAKMETERQENLAQMKKEVQTRKEKMLSEARESVKAAEVEWKRAIVIQRDAFLLDLRKLISQQACLVSKKALADLANAQLENQLINSFIAQLSKLDEQKKKEFKLYGDNSRKAQERVSLEIRTAFLLGDEDKSLLIREVKELIDQDIEPVFKVDSELICGIELRVDGKKIAWSIKNYLDVLTGKLEDMFDKNEEEVIKEKNESN